jgi:aspartate kinase
MRILKFGGTSVGTASRMRALPALLPTTTPCLVVLSAMAGTTNALVQLAQQLGAGERAAAAQHLAALRAHYHGVARELLTDAAVLTTALPAVDSCFDTMAALLAAPLTPAAERVILAQGELLSTVLFHQYLTGLVGREATLLSALEFMRLRPDHEPDTEFIETQLTRLLQANAGCQCFITQGYVCRDAQGQIDNLKRGGSDYSATLMGAALRAADIQIWTDIDGLHNNDPRVIKSTYPLRELSFDEAADLAYFGAKILHPNSILPAREHGIPVRLLNTMQPEAPGTRISAGHHAEGIKAVAVKDGLLLLKVTSNRRVATCDFLHTVFDSFKRHGIPIDLVSTAETAVSLTVEDTPTLLLIMAELQPFGVVTLAAGMSIVCVVGQHLMRPFHGSSHLVFSALRSITLHMICYGGSANNLCLLIDTADKVRTLQLLNEQVFDGWVNSPLQISKEHPVSELVGY